MEEKTPLTEIEVSPEYIARMQKEGMWAAQYQEPAEFPACPYYMMGYNSVK